MSTEHSMERDALRSKVSKIYTDYWQNKTDGQGMQQAIIDLVNDTDHVARINELTSLDNAYDELDADKFHEYYLKRIAELTTKGGE